MRTDIHLENFFKLFQHRGTIWWRWQQYLSTAVFPFTAHIQVGPFSTGAQTTAACNDPHDGQRDDVSSSVDTLYIHGQYPGNEPFWRQVYVPGWGWGRDCSTSKFWRPVLGTSNSFSGKGSSNTAIFAERVGIATMPCNVRGKLQ